ncbi:MAG: hypothetical protein ACLQLG_00740 [Thermoguttaceae bacterium]
MPIPVVCPKCRKSFRVSEKFAGKSGPCPNCKAILTVPALAPEVKIHTPEAFAGGGKSVTGKLVTKPIARLDVKIQPLAVALIAAAAVGIVLVAAAGRMWDLQAAAWTWTNYLVVTAGLLLVSPALVLAAYSFLRDDELEPYRGRALYLRAGACALGYMALWGMFGPVARMFLSDPDAIWMWVFIAPPFLVLGALAALGSLDLDFGSGAFHYSFYLVVTILLRWVAGIGWVWDVGK